MCRRFVSLFFENRQGVPVLFFEKRQGVPVVKISLSRKNEQQEGNTY